MEIEFHPEAENEFIEASRRYETKVPGLGDKFINELEGLQALLIQNPRIGAHIGDPFRRVVFRRFPFSLIYAIEATRIWVIAVAHQSRRPGYWLRRHDR